MEESLFQHSLSLVLLIFKLVCQFYLTGIVVLTVYGAINLKEVISNNSKIKSIMLLVFLILIWPHTVYKVISSFQRYKPSSQEQTQGKNTYRQ